MEVLIKTEIINILGNTEGNDDNSYDANNLVRGSKLIDSLREVIDMDSNIKTKVVVQHISTYYYLDLIYNGLMVKIVVIMNYHFIKNSCIKISVVDLVYYEVNSKISMVFDSIFIHYCIYHSYTLNYVFILIYLIYHLKLLDTVT